MRRSRTVEGSGGGAEAEQPTAKNGSSNGRGGSSKRERWSFALKRRWFSSSTSRAASHDVDIAAPSKTTLGAVGGARRISADSTGGVPDRPDDSTGGVSKRKSLRCVLDLVNLSKVVNQAAL